MHTSGSILKTIVERTRFLLDRPSTDRYIDDYLVRNVIMPKFVEVMNSIDMSSGELVVLRQSLSLVAGTEYYQLPPNIGSILRLVIRDTASGLVTNDWKPRNENHPDGVGWRLEGNTLAFRPIPQDDTEWELWHLPTGNIELHYATDGAIVNASTITLSAAPALGMLDRNENAYVGQKIRCIPTSGGTIQTRIISQYAATTRTATLRTPLDLSSGNVLAIGALTYEIAMYGYQSLWNAIACKAAMFLGIPAGLSQARMRSIDIEYNAAMKAATDFISNRNERVSKHHERATVDHRDDELDLFSWSR